MTAVLEKEKVYGRPVGFRCTDEQREHYRQASLKRWADPTYRKNQIAKLKLNFMQYHHRVVEVKIASRISVANLHKNCPRCHSLLLHNYGELECWSCGFSQDIKTGQEFGR